MILEVKPSSLFAEFEIGEVFESAGERWMLISRDPWQAKIARYTKLDEWVANSIDWCLRRK